MVLEIFLGLFLTEGILIILFRIADIFSTKSEVIDADYVKLDDRTLLFAEESDFFE